MTMMNPANFRTTRRSFIRQGSLLGAAAAAAVGSTGVVRAAADTSPNDKIVVGIMGTAGRGTALASLFASMPDAAVKYVCDVDDAHAAACAKTVAGKQTHAPEAVRDFRKILDDKGVDAIVIATPDHWHAIAAILGCQAGKHVYVEKPCSHNPQEGELLLAAARKHGRVVQHGTQRRSYPKVAEAIGRIHKGEIGNVRFSRGWYTNNRPETGRRTPAPVPKGLDWSLWQGPAPEQAFTENVVHYKWHWFWHWGTGEMGNNGIHSLDICRWGLDVDCPTRVTAGGGRYWFEDDQETPDTMNVTFDYGDKCIVWEGRSCQPRGIEGSSFGIAFYGDKGSLVIDGGGYTVYDLKNKEVDKVAGPALRRPARAELPRLRPQRRAADRGHRGGREERADVPRRQHRLPRRADAHAGPENSPRGRRRGSGKTLEPRLPAGVGAEGLELCYAGTPASHPSSPQYAAERGRGDGTAHG